MKMKLSLTILALAALTAFASTQSAPTISGDYLEVRSCDVYTGPCFANAEMNLSGKEGILVWSVREGSWKGTSLGGLSVIAVVCTDGTLGDMRYQPRAGKAVLIIDEKADAQQREALSDLARSMAGNLVEVNTRCLGGHDHLCSNEETYYPPLTSVEHAMPAFTERASFKGSGLNLTWEATGQRSAFLASFSR